MSGVARRGASPYYVALATTDPTPRRRLLPDETPFDPIGIQVGAFNFKPAIELTGGYDTNPARTSSPTPSWYSIVAPELKFNSNWARHEFTGDLRGSYYTYEELPSQNRPNVDGKLIGRIDVTRDTRVDLETKYLVGTDSPGSPNIQAGLAKLPIFTTYGGTVGFGHRFNRFDISLKGGAERTVYQELDLHRRLDREQRGPQLQPLHHAARAAATSSRRASSRLSRSAPIAACTISRSISSAMQRNSDGRYHQGRLDLRVRRASSPATSPSAGSRASYQDPTLPNVSGLTFDASLTWVVSALTTAKLTAVTRADKSRVVGVSGVFTREVTLQVDHAFRRWLIATAEIRLRPRQLCRLGSRRQPLFGVGGTHLQAHPRSVAEVRVSPRMAALLGLGRELRCGRHLAGFARAAVICHGRKAY